MGSLDLLLVEQPAGLGQVQAAGQVGSEEPVGLVLVQLLVEEVTEVHQWGLLVHGSERGGQSVLGTGCHVQAQTG